MTGRIMMRTRMIAVVFALGACAWPANAERRRAPRPAPRTGGPGPGPAKQAPQPETPPAGASSGHDLPRRGLVALWSAEGNARDSAGRNHGRLRNGATFAPGKVGLAFKLDGQDDYVDMGNPPALQITGSQTIAMWIRPERLGGRRNPLAKAYGGEGTVVVEPTGELTYMYGSSGRDDAPYGMLTSFGQAGDEGHAAGEIKVYKSAKVAVKAKEWAHIAAVRDLKARRLRWYVNGKLASESDASFAAAKASNQPLYIGKGYLKPFVGLIDEVAIWNRALSGEEIRAVSSLWAGGTDPVARGLVALWAADGNATDSLGLHHGTLKGGAGFAPGRSGQAFQLDGEDDCVEIADRRSLRITGSQSIAMWLCPDRLDVERSPLCKASGGEGAIVLEPRGELLYYYGTAGGNDAPYCLLGTFGKVLVQTKGKTEALLRPSGPGAPLKAKQWTHVVAVRDLKAKKLRWYVNGTLVAQGDAALGPARASSLPLRIGGGTHGNFAGLIDEVAIWNRALSAEDIRGVFQARHLADVLSGAGAPHVVRDPLFDRIVLDNGEVLKGTIENEAYEATTFLGKLTIPAERVVALGSPGRGESRVWLALADGQVVLGMLARPTVRLKLSTGSTLNVPWRSVRQCAYRISDERPAEPQAPGAMLLLRSRERVAWTAVKHKLELLTPYAKIDLPAERVARIDLAARRGSTHRVRLANGSTLCGTLLPEKLTLALRLAPQVTIDRWQLRALWRPVQTAKAAGAATVVMRNGDRMVGRVAEDKLTIRTRFGEARVAPVSLLRIQFEVAKDGAITVSVRTWDGVKLRGPLAEKAVRFQFGPAGLVLKLAARHIASIERDVALPPPAVARKIHQLIAQLGAEAHLDREAATQALMKMGPNIIPLLRKHLSSPDPEVRQRIETILGKLGAGS